MSIALQKPIISFVTFKANWKQVLTRTLHKVYPIATRASKLHFIQNSDKPSFKINLDIRMAGTA